VLFGSVFVGGVGYVDLYTGFQGMSENRTILVVDDDRDCLTMVKTILAASGYQVETCSSGQDALQRLLSFAPSLVVLDIMMPGMSGYDVVVHMKQRPETQNLPIIMLTAKGDPDDLLTGYKDYGVEYYITKPFTTRQLLAGVKLVLGQH
jgi:DNA-binding response OmpR family regulator